MGSYYFDVKNYYLMALLVMLACMLPFFMVFEGRKPQARELTIIAVLCALGVAARAAFFMLPQFKPVVALTIISGVAFGGETGFLVGAMTMLASNFLFSQGPWTPFQMFAAGIIGFLAGVLFRKGWLRRSRAALCSYGAIAAIVLYGGLMTINICLLFPFISHLRIPEGLYASALFGLPSSLSGAFFTGSLDVACLFHKAVFRFDAIQLLQHRLCQHP